MSILKSREPFLVKEFGAWKFTFYYKEKSIKNTFLSIISTSGQFNCRIGGNNEAYYFLLHCAQKNDVAVLHDYITRIACLATIWNDTKLASDVNNALNDWNKRKEAEGAEAAKNVTDTDEQVSQAVMEAVVAPHDSKQFKKDVSELWDKLNNK